MGSRRSRWRWWKRSYLYPLTKSQNPISFIFFHDQFECGIHDLSFLLDSFKTDGRSTHYTTIPRSSTLHQTVITSYNILHGEHGRRSYLFQILGAAALPAISRKRKFQFIYRPHGALRTSASLRLSGIRERGDLTYRTKVDSLRC